MLSIQVLSALLAAPFLFLSSQAPTTTHVSLRHAAGRSEAGTKAPFLPREVFLRQPTIGDVRLSPDGRPLAFVRYNGPQAEVLLQDVASGVATRLVAETRGVEIAWSGDGRLLWIADEDGMAVLDSATGTAKRILEWDERRAQRFWRVDARAADYAIIQERPAPGTTAPYHYLLVNAAGKTRPLHESALPLLDVVLTTDGQLAFAAAYDGPQYDKVIRQFTPGGVRELLRCTGIETCRIAGRSEERRVGKGCRSGE